MRIPGHPRIDVDPEICFGRPRIAGTRMRVIDILEAPVAGTPVEQILAGFSYISSEDVRACLAYAAHAVDHRVVLPAE